MLMLRRLWMHSFEAYVNPHLGKLLRTVGMDKSYVRGEGCCLYDDNNIEYLDCIAAYGALPFGYNPKEIWDSILRFQKSQEPTFIQPSFLDAAGELAKRLIELTPEKLKYVTFTNSGAETVEAAIKMCRSATGRKGILTTTNSFHGKTLGALSATGKEYYQKAFGAPVEYFHYVKYGDLTALEEELNRRDEYYAAFIVEPIQGEGGIIVPPAGYIKQAQKICEKYGVLMILDEVQTGLGRTGSLFAFEQEDCYPDVLLLAKALGGGIIPIGACIASEKAYNEEFALKHSSTFAGNSLACRIALTTIDMLTRENMKLIKQVKSNGEWLKSQLEDIRNSYPDLIASIRGQGLMLGIEFKINRKQFPDGFIGIMGEQEILTPVIASYLLNCERIRVAPTLNGNDVIRIEPPLIISREQCNRAVDGIENMMEVLNEGNTARLVAHLVGREHNGYYYKKRQNYRRKNYINIDVNNEKDIGRFAFLVHPLDMENYIEFDQSLESFTTDQIRDLAGRLNDLVDPFVIGGTLVTSKTGAKAYGEFICIPRTAEDFMTTPVSKVLGEIKKAIRLAKDRGAGIVGLGAYTSVVSKGGLYLKDESVPLTTGNSYTALSAVDAVEIAVNRWGHSLQESVAAVIGATGSIGRNVAVLLAEKVSKIILVGNSANPSSSIKRMFDVAAQICKRIAELLSHGYTFNEGTIGYWLNKRLKLSAVNSTVEIYKELMREIQFYPGCPIVVTTSLESALGESDIVVSATSSTGKIINPVALKCGAIICDISRPRNIGEEVRMVRPDVLVIDGGVIEVPGLPNFGWNFGFDKGLAYACMAETMMLALDRHYKSMSIGSSGVNLESILFMQHLADKHGFKVAELRSFDRPLTADTWKQVKL